MSIQICPAPSCTRPLDPEAHYCRSCGLEVYQPCTCREERLWLAKLPFPHSPWCKIHQTLMHACERCGRWLKPEERRCPASACGSARTLPYFPQHTGRRWDGRGTTVGWRWPASWPVDRAPVPRVDEWTSQGTVLSAFAAHGRLFVWQEQLLVEPSWPISDPHRAIMPGQWPGEDPSGETTWHSSLDTNAAPARLPISELIAVAGAAAVLAMGHEFRIANLCPDSNQEAISLQEGVEGPPLAQVGGPHWWAGWQLAEGTPQLSYGAVPDAWDALVPSPVEVPEGGSLAANGRLVMRDDRIYWPGEDRGIWQLDCATGQVDPVVDPEEGSPVVWAEKDGPRCARDGLALLKLELSPAQGGRSALTVPAGAGPLLGVFALPDVVVAAGQSIRSFDPTTGMQICEAPRPFGVWRAAALAPAEEPKADPRLLILSDYDGGAVLTAVPVLSEPPQEIWRKPGVKPLGLLPVDDALYVIHEQGVIRLTEATQ